MQKRPYELLQIAYGENGKTSVLSAPSTRQALIYSIKVGNGSGNPIGCGILRKLDTTAWKFYSHQLNNTPDATDKTSLIQAGTAQVLFISGQTNSGFAFAANRKFNLIGLNISTQETGSPVYVYEYWNGTTWSTLTTIEVSGNRSTGTAGYFTGTQLITFLAPYDWALTTDSSFGSDTAMYCIRVRASTLPTVFPQADSAWLGQFLDFAPSVPDKCYLEIKLPDDRPFIFEGRESVLPYFTGVASNSNFVNISYSVI